MASKESDLRSRPSIGRWLDRVCTPLLALGGRLLKRPTDLELSAQSGRTRGGDEAFTAVDALEAGRRALADDNFAEALVQFGLAVERDPDSAWAWHGRGDALLMAGVPIEALVAFDQALVLDAKSSLAHLGRGNALVRLQRDDEAKSAWHSALEIDPKLKWAKTALADLEARET
jgi:tetratricopeptide (TPR) repeat protein